MSKKHRQSKIIPSIVNEEIVPPSNIEVEVIIPLQVSGMVEVREDINHTSVTEVVNEVTITPTPPTIDPTPTIVTPQTVVKVMSKVGRIDNLILTAHGQGKKLSAKEIYGVIKMEYPSCDEVATLRTINCRPWHLRNAGKLPATTKGKKEVAIVVATPTQVEVHA